VKRKVLFAIFGALFFILGTSTLTMAPSGGKPEPLPSSNFIVEIDGLASAQYMSVEGLGSTMEVVEYRSGADPNHVILLPGVARYGPITLKRGLSEDTELWDWYESNLDAPVERKSMSIVFMDHGHEEKARYNLHECWVSEYHIEPLSASPSDVAVEVIVIQTELIERA
jgi:phage tail-like protein